MPDESTARVALATCAQVPDLDRDTKTLLFPLARIGIDVRAAVWSDCRVDWGQYDLTVVRSCWDYHENRDRFLAWARAVDHLANPAGVLAWNAGYRPHTISGSLRRRRQGRPAAQLRTPTIEERT